MSHDLIIKKLEQIKILIGELKQLLTIPFQEFKSKFTNIRSAERNYQLIIELASDINAHLIAELGGQTPDTYRESFKTMISLNLLDKNFLFQFVKSANLRNILIHEYDFDEDNFIFYKSANDFVPLYEGYIKSILEYLNKTDKNVIDN